MLDGQINFLVSYQIVATVQDLALPRKAPSGGLPNVLAIHQRGRLNCSQLFQALIRGHLEFDLRKMDQPEYPPRYFVSDLIGIGGKRSSKKGEFWFRVSLDLRTKSFFVL